MNLLRTYGIPLFVLVPVAWGLGLLWYCLLPFATSDGLMLLLFFFMCLLGIAASGFVQFILSRFPWQKEKVDERADESYETKRK